MNKLRIAALLVIAGTGLSTSAHAFTYTTGDVLIGFRSTNGGISTDYVIDIGQSLLTTAASNGGHVTIGTFGTDLASFDPNWFTDGTTVWGVAGGTLSGDTSRTLYAGYGENSVNPLPGTTYNGRISANQNTTIGFFNAAGSGASGGAAATGSPVGNTGSSDLTLNGFQLQQTSNSGSWAATEGFTAGVGFRQFAGFDSAIGTGSLGDNIDYYKIVPTAGAAPTLQGTFSVDSAGTITFSTVPEPSALTALAGGIGLLGFLRRRRAVIA